MNNLLRTFQLPVSPLWVLRTVLAIVLLSHAFHLSAQKTDEVQLELRSKADLLFDAGDFESAAPLYSQLLSLSPKDTLVSFQFGACQSMSPSKSRSAIPYLEPALSLKRPPKDLYYFYGRSLMAEGRFQDAAAAFRGYTFGNKDRRSEAEILLANCENAISLSGSRNRMPVITEREISIRNFFSAYEFVPKGGKVVPAAEQFLSKSEREKLLDPVMFISADQQTIYLAKYARGSSELTDLHIVIRQSNGQWSEAVPLVSSVNSDKAEDYPFLDPSGRTLYFSSKGFNSIGGFDIFRSEYDFSTGGWSAPVNMGLGVNTIGDDMLFVPASDGSTASYVTTDRAEAGKAFFRTVELPRSQDQMVQVKGFYRSADQQMRRDARISIVRQNDKALVATANTDDRTGQYSLNVPASGDYYLVVEGGGYVPHIERFSIPEGVDMDDIKQSVIMDRSGNDEKMQVKNYFRSTSEQLLASEEPSETITRTYVASDVDSSALVPIRIGDVTLFLPEPAARIDGLDPNSEATALATSSEGVGSDPVEAATYPVDTSTDTPGLGVSGTDKTENTAAVEVLTETEVDNDVVETQSTPQVEDNPFVQPDISDADLARLALEDARDNRDEAAELRQEAEAIRTQASEKRSLASTLAEGIDLNDSLARSKNRTVFEQAEDLEEDAALSETRAAQLDSMAMERELSAEFSEREAARLTRKDPIVSSRSSRKAVSNRSTVATTTDILSATATNNAGRVDVDDNLSGSATSSNTLVDGSSRKQIELSGQEVMSAPQEVAITGSKSSALSAGNADQVQERSLTEDLITGEKTPSTTEVESDEASARAISTAESDKLVSQLPTNVSASTHRDFEKDSGIEAVNSNPSLNNSYSKSESTTNGKTLPDVASDSAIQALAKNERSKSNPEDAIHDGQPDNTPATRTQVSVQTESDQSTRTSTGEVVMTEEDVAVASHNRQTENRKSGLQLADGSGSQPLNSTSDKVSKPNPSLTSDNNAGDQLIASEKVRVLGTPTDAVVSNTDKSSANLSSPASESKGNVSIVESDTDVAYTTSAYSKPSVPESAQVEEDSNLRSGQIVDESSLPDNPLSETVVPSSIDNSRTSYLSSDSASKNIGYSTVQAIPVTAEDVRALRQSNLDYDLQAEEEDGSIENSEAVSLVPDFKGVEGAEVDSISTPAKVAVWVQASLENKRKAEILDRQSNFLRQKTEELPEGEERDSVLQLSYEFSSEATRLYSLADRQMAKARSTDLAAVQQITGAEQLRAQDASEDVENADAPTLEALAMTDRINKSKPNDDSSTERIDVDVNTPVSTTSDRSKTSAVAMTQEAVVKSPDADVEQDAGFTIPIRYTDQSNYSDNPKSVVSSNQPVTSTGRNQNNGTTGSVAPEKKSDNAGGIQKRQSTASSDKVLADNKTIERKTSTSTPTEVPAKPGSRISDNGDSPRVQPTSPGRSTEDAILTTVPAGAESTSGQEPTARFASEEDEKRYQMLSEQAEAGRKQTIDAFSEAVRLNKEAVTARETYLSTLKAADEATDSVRRMELMDQSETLLELSVKNEEAARVKYAEAQQLTKQVQVMTDEAEALTLESKSVSTSGQSDVATDAASATPTWPIGDEPLVLQSKTPDGVSAYATDRPIPRDPPLPQGLVFKVQIGAFRKPIPESTFGGLRPLTAENSRPGWIRYCIGIFKAFEPANLVKKEMRRMGFKDAFVVAYLDGKRISLSQAYELINSGGLAEKTAYAVSLKEETASLRKLDIVASRYPKVMDPDEDGFYGTSSKSSLKAESASGVTEYAVQVGVYKTDVAPSVLAVLQPLQTELIRERLYRFTTGRFQEYGQADSLRRIAVDAGVKDAFVVAYRDGNRVSVTAEARKKRVDAARVEPSSPQPPVVDANISESPGPLMVSQGVVFRVQIGAFRQNVPFEVVDAFLKISDQGIEREKDDRGLQIFYAGKYEDFNSAVAAKEQAIQRGVKDAFVVAFQDGKRISLDLVRKAVGR